MGDSFKCPVCGHWCIWVDTHWVCAKRGGCGSEWLPTENETVAQWSINATISVLTDPNWRESNRIATAVQYLQDALNDLEDNNAR